MPTFEVVFNRHDRGGSDAAVGTHPTTASTVVQPLVQALVATVEAEGFYDAAHAARVAYGVSTSEVDVHDVSEKYTAETAPAEQTAEPVEPTDTAESVQADAEVVFEPEVTFEPEPEPTTEAVTEPEPTTEVEASQDASA